MMAINIKSSRVEELVEDVTKMTGETKTEAIRKALEERKQRLNLSVTPNDRRARLREFLETEVWPTIRSDVLGERLPKKDKERILGYGPEGV